MNTNIYNVNDKEFANSLMYQNYLNNNPSYGYLRIRAYAASEAIPIQGLKVLVTGNILNNKVIFYEGYTNESGIIEKIKLPAPRLDSDNLEAPNKTVYEILATYLPDNKSEIYKVNMYEDICVVQNINIVPDMVIGMGDL